jgi:hypothetical protein
MTSNPPHIRAGIESQWHDDTASQDTNLDNSTTLLDVVDPLFLIDTDDAESLWIGDRGAIDSPSPTTSLVGSPGGATTPSASISGLSGAAMLEGTGTVGLGGATAAQVCEAVDDSGLSVTGAGIKVGVLSDSFNDLGGAAADEADGALPSTVTVVKDLPSGGTDEGRAIMQVVHDIAPGASLYFYTAFESEQDFANGILTLASDGCKVICDDVSYYDEPFFQNGIVAQAIQTVEQEGVVYVTAAGNDASNAYQSAWTPIQNVTVDGVSLKDAESFGGSPLQTITIGDSPREQIPLLLEWNQPYGSATSGLEMLVFKNGRFLGSFTNASDGEPNNPWIGVKLAGGNTYQIAIENTSGPNPGLIKEIAAGDGISVSISGANVGSVYGHAMSPDAITVGAVSTAETPAFGVSPPEGESFSSSGAGTELLFSNNGTALETADLLNPVTVSGVDDIQTTLSGNLGDFYGTSAATPTVAAIAALMLQENPDLSPGQVSQLLAESAIPFGNSAVSGAGLVQADVAVNLAAETSSACYCRGTKILTDRGEVPVEDLCLGDLLMTIDGQAMPIVWIGHQTVSTTFSDPLRVLPIRIKAGALDDNVPSRDLLVSPDHAILVDQVLIQAGALVNGSSIVREAEVPATFTYYHIELDVHTLIQAENAPAETFVDNVDRLAFDNWQEHETLYVDGKTITEMPYPRAKAYRQVPQSVRQRLAQRGQRIHGTGVLSVA